VRRVRTGIAGLDSVLKGGLPEYSTILIAGAPGTGKTVLSQNILFNHLHRRFESPIHIYTVRAAAQGYQVPAGVHFL